MPRGVPFCRQTSSSPDPRRLQNLWPSLTEMPPWVGCKGGSGRTAPGRLRLAAVTADLVQELIMLLGTRLERERGCQQLAHRLDRVEGVIGPFDRAVQGVGVGRNQ